MGRQHESQLPITGGTLGTPLGPWGWARSFGSFKELLRTSFETFPPVAINMIIETSKSNQEYFYMSFFLCVVAAPCRMSGVEKYLVLACCSLFLSGSFFLEIQGVIVGRLLARQGRGHQIIWIRARRRSVEGG